MAPRKLPKTDFDMRFDEKLAEYTKNYRVEDLNDANDRTLLHIMVKTELMIEDLQLSIRDTMSGENILESASDLKKLSDLLRDSTNTITTIQRTLAIDRKTRKDEESSSVLDYINALRKAAGEFVDERLIKVECPSCKVMVGRFAPVHGHTAFSLSFQCSQCKKMIRAKRDEKDTMFDIKVSDRTWREKYRAEVVQPRKPKAGIANSDMTLEEEASLVLEAKAPVLELDNMESIDEATQEDLEL